MKAFRGFESHPLCQLRVLCNGKTSAFQADDRSSILLTRSITTSNNERLQQMGRVFIEEVMDVTGINRTDLVAACAFLVRSKQASSAAEALRLLETGTINANELEEQMISSLQVENKQEDEIPE